jgi:NADP-dependent 3-hydroxy acid dehydrogenase YdfG
VLTPEDCAELVAFIVSRPPQVHVCDAVVRPTRQDYP